MTRITSRAIAASVLLTAAACADSATNPSPSADLTGALAASLTGSDAAPSSFAPSASAAGWTPGIGDDRLEGLAGHRGGFGLMGGGISDDFRGPSGSDTTRLEPGDDHGGRRGHRGPFGDFYNTTGCTFAAATGRVDCTAVTRHGLTITRSFAFTDAAGAVQQALDTVTTNTVNVRVQVSGTVVSDDSRRHRGQGRGEDDAAAPAGARRDTTTVSRSSDRTVSGLASGSAQRTINGTSSGTETTVGNDSVSHFTVTRVAGDTVTGLVVPVPATGPSYPTAGTVVRSMQVTFVRDGRTPQTVSRREVLVYDGTATARLTVTQDGATKNCTVPLPRGRPSCS